MESLDEDQDVSLQAESLFGFQPSQFLEELSCSAQVSFPSQCSFSCVQDNGFVNNSPFVLSCPQEEICEAMDVNSVSSTPDDAVTRSLDLEDFSMITDSFFINQEHVKSSAAPSVDTSAPPSLSSSLQTSILENGLTETAEEILKHTDLKDTIFDLLLKRANQSLKKSLSKSILHSKEKKRVGRKYLLTLTPIKLCEEVRDAAPDIFKLIVTGLLGVGAEEFQESHHISNILALMYGTAARENNRKASGFCLQLTTIARDGGMREDSIKLIPNMCAPRTAQRYDVEVLAEGWDNDRNEALALEVSCFYQLKEAEDELVKAMNSMDVIDAKRRVELATHNLPPQLQIVWDNINLRMKHRFERKEDCYSDFNYDWMVSLLIQERISANHMEHKTGSALKDPEGLKMEDFIPNSYEKSYILDSLVHYYSYRLVTRHPEVFKSIKSVVKVLYFKYTFFL